MDAATAERAPAEESRFSLRRLRRNLTRDVTATIGMVALIVIMLVTLFAPLLAPYDYAAVNVLNRFQAPSSEHLLGTDAFGRDVLSRILIGGRASLLVALLSVGSAMILGVAIGAVTGFLGGIADDITGRLVDMMLSFPTLLLGLMVVAALGPGAVNTAIAIAVSLLPRFIRLARGATIVLREREFIAAAHASGQRPLTIVYRHVLRNIIGPIVVMGSLWTAEAIRIEANLSFLGLGVQPPQPSWGNLIREGVERISLAPWLAIFPGIAISLSILALNLVGDGVRDLLDPKLSS